MTTELMKIIAQENLETHIEKELEEEIRKDLIHPLQVWITRWDSQTPGFMILGVTFRKDDKVGLSP